MLTGLQERVGHRKGIDETRTDRLNVERGAVIHTQTGLDDGRCRRENEIRRGGRHHDQVDVCDGQASIVERAPCRLDPKVRGRLPFSGDVPLRNPGSLPDPGIAGIDLCSQFVIGQDPVGKIAPASGNSGDSVRHD